VGFYGKNFLENTFASHTVNGVAITNNGDGSVTLNGTATENAIFTLGYISQKLGNDFVLSGVKGSVVLYATYTKNGVYVSETWNTSGETSLRDDIEYDKVSVSVYIAKGITCNNATIYPMVRHKNYNSEFEQGKTPQTLTLTDTLRGIDDIADEIDFARGVKIQRAYAVDLSTLEWTMSYDSIFSAILPHSAIGTSWAQTSNVLCTHYKPTCVSGNGMGVFDDGGDDCITLGDGASVNYIHVKDSSYTDSASFKASLGGVYLVYPLSTPIETPLTESELNAYRQLYTNKGNTTILSEADMEVSYVADTKLYIDNKLAELTALALEV
jgi:hypothetical protein